MSRPKLSTATVHARGEARRVIAVLVILLWGATSIICPVPASAGEAVNGHGGSHGVQISGDEHDHADLCCEILGYLNVASAQCVDQRLSDQFWPEDYPLPTDLTAPPSALQFSLSQPHSPATGPPRLARLKFTKIWPQAPPV